MKRFTSICLRAILALMISSISSGLAAPQKTIPSEPERTFAPGSIIQFDHLTIEDGLSQNAGLSVFQDSRGYLWIGTQDGLDRYDGYGFQVFKNDPDDPNSISQNSILCITEDQDGMLWIGTWGGGLNRFDPATEKFTSYLPKPDDPSSLGDATVTSLKIDSTGTLWVGTLGGLDRYNSATNSFDHFRNNPNDLNSLSSNAISVIFEDSHKQLWIGTGTTGVDGAGLNRFDPMSGKVTRFQHDASDPESLASNNISALVEGSDGTIWIATGGFSLRGNGLDQFDPRTGQAIHFQHNEQNEQSLSGDDLMTLWLDQNNVLWIGAWATGLNRMDLSNPGVFMRFQNDPYFPESLSGNEVWSLYQDRSGILWVGTSHSGINKLAASSEQFNLYRNNPRDPASVSVNAIGAFAEDKGGNIWIATWGGGLDRFNPNDGKFQHYHHDPQNAESLSDDSFMAVYVDPYNTVWAGTLGQGLNRLDPATGRVTHYLHNESDPTSLADDNIATIISDGQNGLWIGSFGGVSHYDPKTDTFTNYSHNSENSASLSENKVVSLFIDSSNTLWIGTWGGGLNQLDLSDPHHSNPQTATFTNYRHHADDLSSLSEDSVWSIHGTFDGTLWFGTQLGLNQFDPQSKTFKHYTEKNGLPNNVVLGILADDSGDLWLTTNDGLSKFDPEAGTFKNYNVADGLQSNEFNSNAYYRSRNGNMYIGGINGFNSFDPQDIKPNPIPPEVVFTRFTVFNQPVSVDLTGRTPLQLSYQQNFISFEFAAFDFKSPLKNQYAYKLEGFNKDWIYAGTHRYATYTNLPGGNYIFRVKAANSDGVWNEAGVAIPISITPPIWQTWWFLASVAVVLGALVAGGFRYRLNSIREQNVFLEMQVSDRTSELRETNTLLQKEIEQRKRAEEALARRAADELQQSEERFRAIFENSAIGIALAGLDGLPQMVNPAIVRMTGYSESELMQMPGLDLSYSEDRESSAISIKELLEGKHETYRSESRFVRKNGQVYWVRQTISAVCDSNGQPLYLIIMVEDIDEQKRNIASLRESEARFRSMFEHSAIGIGLMNLDRRLMDVNSALCRIYGRTRGEMIGLNAAEVTYPEDNSESTNLFTEIVMGQRDSYEMDRRYLRKNGEVFWAHVTMSSVRGPDGKPLYLVGMVMDIDQQKHAAEELRKSQARFQAIFDNVAVGVAVMTLERRPVAFNATAEKIIGYIAAEMQNVDPRELAVMEDRNLDNEWFKDLVAGKRESYVMERRYRRKNGNIFWARINYSLVRDLDGKPDYLIGLIEDIDEQKRAAERLAAQEADYLLTLQHKVNERTHELEEANQRLQAEIQQRAKIEKTLAEKAAIEAVTADRTRLARDLHDAVTQTLFSSSLIAEVLPELWDMDVEEAKKSTEELRQLTRGALAEMRTLLLELRPATLTQTRLSELIKQLCEAFIGRSRLPISMNIEGDCELPPEVQIAFYRIAQESLNNVFKYARATQVNVNLFISPTTAHFETCDNGIGFDMATSKPTSLGMRIMHERAEMIGAELDIASGLGEGTCVSVTWTKDPERTPKSYSQTSLLNQ
jgi:PAS domain S-box-containing protein